MSYERKREVARAATFSINGEQTFAGWTFDQTWNGWAVPYFTEEVAEQVTAWLRAGGSRVQWINGRTIEVDDGQPEPALFGRVVIQTAEGPKAAWCIGGGEWVWDEVEA